MNKRKASIFAIIAFITLIIISIISVRKSLNAVKITDPELLRAMTYEQFGSDADRIEGTDYVKFSAFFLRDINGDGYAEKIKGTCKEIGKQDTLYMELNVLTKGYLKDAKIQIDGKNFFLQTALPKDSQIKENAIGNDVKEIKFNNLTNGTQKLMAGFAKSEYYTNSGKTSAIGNNINNYTKDDNTIILTGTYVGEDEVEVPIRKEINLTVDWYGTTKTRFAELLTNRKSQRNQRYEDLDDRISEEGAINLSFELRTQETNQKLLLSKNYVEGTIPELNGYAPTEVTTSTSNAQFTYKNIYNNKNS